MKVLMMAHQPEVKSTQNASKALASGAVALEI